MTAMLPESDARLRRNAAVVYRAAAAGLRPDPRQLVSDWAEQFRIVADGGAVPGKWRNSTAPYLIEPMDACSPDDPCEEIIILKASQSGGSAVGENFLGFIFHRAPGPAMYIAPTVLAAKDWREEKLWPTIEATPVLNPAKGGAVMPMRSRSGEGSTTLRVKFKGGYCLLAGANSAATLRQHSIRFMVRDDVGGWTDNADGEGDPVVLSFQRLKTYRFFNLSKCLDISTPLDKGDKFDLRYEESDRRRYYMACLGCGAITDFVWEDVRKEAAAPYHCHVVCPLCDRQHFQTDKAAMLMPENGACWIPTAPDSDGIVPPKTIPKDDIARWRHRHTGRYRKGYAITGEMNAFERWDLIAKAEAEAGDDPEKQKPFQNTTLGRVYEAKSEGPGWESLAARRESDWSRGTIPSGVLYLSLSVDVQDDGLYWERIGWAPGKQMWTVGYGYLAGRTNVPLEGAWLKLDAVCDRGAQLNGVALADDIIGVDSGYNAEAVYSWVKQRDRAFALKGEDGWSKPPIFRTQAAEVRKKGPNKGKAARFGLKVWLVGTWGIKSTLLNYLARSRKSDDGRVPTGYCHFPADAEEQYFRQLTTEYVTIEKTKDGPVRRWAKRGPNHWFDCRVQNYALSHLAGLWAWDDSRWQKRAAELEEMIKSPVVLKNDAVADTPVMAEGETPDEPAAKVAKKSAPVLPMRRVRKMRFG